MSELTPDKIFNVFDKMTDRTVIEIDREILRWESDAQKSQTNAWLVAFGVVAGLKIARDMVKSRKLNESEKDFE